MNIIEIPINLNDFFSFEHGVPISNRKIEQWMKEGLINLRKEINMGHINPSYTCGTGNTIVFMNAYIQSNGKYTITLRYATVYSSKDFIDIEV